MSIAVTQLVRTFGDVQNPEALLLHGQLDPNILEELVREEQLEHSELVRNFIDGIDARIIREGLAAPLQDFYDSCSTKPHLLYQLLSIEDEAPQIVVEYLERSKAFFAKDYADFCRSFDDLTREAVAMDRHTGLVVDNDHNRVAQVKNYFDELFIARFRDIRVKQFELKGIEKMDNDYRPTYQFLRIHLGLSVMDAQLECAATLFTMMRDVDMRDRHEHYTTLKQRAEATRLTLGRGVRRAMYGLYVNNN